MNTELERAKRLIDAYTLEEFNAVNDWEHEDLSDIGVAYTTLGDNEEYELQVCVDLENLRIEKLIDGGLYEFEEYGSLEELNDIALKYLNFEDLISLNDYESLGL